MLAQQKNSSKESNKYSPREKSPREGISEEKNSSKISPRDLPLTEKKKSPRQSELGSEKKTSPRAFLSEQMSKQQNSDITTAQQSQQWLKDFEPKFSLAPSSSNNNNNITMKRSTSGGSDTGAHAIPTFKLDAAEKLRIQESAKKFKEENRARTSSQ